MNEMLDGALKIIKRINEASYEAYIVGGFVRDYLLGVPSNDIDITTSASPDLVEKLFKDHFNKSLKYRTITVRMNGYEYEVTTYRTDNGYVDHRHPSTKYATSLAEDVKRRDFTINALCLNKELKVTDLVNGKSDLDNGIIRAIGKPFIRFSEDALRMFRAFRFASRFNFIIEPKTYNAICECSFLVQYLSKERIRAELEQIVKEKYFENYISSLIQSNILKIYPETLNALKVLSLNYKKIDIIELVLLTSIIKGELVKEIMLTRKEEKFINSALELFDLYKRRMISKYTLLDLEDGIISSLTKVSSILRVNSYTEGELNDLIHSMPIKKSKDLALTGNDIKEYFSLSDSPLIGELIDKALKMVIDLGIENKKEVLLNALDKEMKERTIR